MFGIDNIKKIKKEDIDLTNKIGYGVEGIVYDIGDNEVAKLLHNPTETKMTKVSKLSKLKVNNFIFPEKIILDKYNDKIGYTMKKINMNEYESLDNKFEKIHTVTNKIDYLKQLENNLKKAHKKGLVVVDFNFENFVSNDKNLLMLDTDNYTYKKFITDMYPRYYFFYYFEKVEKDLTPNVDKFMFTMKLLENIVKNPFENLDLTGYYNDDLVDYIKKLDVNKEIKNFLLMQISDSKNKEYFGNIIDELRTDDEFIYTR